VEVRCHTISDTALCEEAYAAGRVGVAIFTPGWLPGFNPGPVFARADFNSVSAIVAAARAGKAQFDAAAAKACLDAVRGLACTDVPHAPALLADVCLPVFTGTVADGDRCISDLECANRSSLCTASMAAASCDGICTPGGPLCNTDRQCPSGQACDWTMSGDTSYGTCVTAVAPGGANQPCGTGLSCQSDLTCVNGTCMSRPTEGQGCNVAYGPFQECATGLVCVQNADNTLTCMQPAMKGQSCQGKNQCGGIISSLTCDETRHTCVDWTAGGACSAGCPYTAYCDQASATCKPDKPIGSACRKNDGTCGSFGADCLSADPSAVAGVCTPLLPPTCTP
jgi:hypothetical protein